MPTPDENADEFLAVSDQFRLGSLVTEAPHPVTHDLSTLAKEAPDAAVESIREVDLEALRALEEAAPRLGPLAEAVGATVRDGRRIFLCGCGATGRLSVSLEIFARHGLLGDAVPAGQITGFMAGGDAALVRSIENFEDHPEWGARMLDELGFADGDLLISTTEGGETPYVIGATERAAELSPENPPFFLYCNPDPVLVESAERSRHVLENPNIHPINLTVGPMALTGSTRMEASTALMAGVGWAIAARGRRPGGEIAGFAADLRALVTSSAYATMTPLTVAEAACYQRGDGVVYEPGPFAITVMTDTTERSPTFSVAPFENLRRPGDPTALCHLTLESASGAEEAWRQLLGGRAPRSIEWGTDGLVDLAGMETLLGFDFSAQARDRREKLTGQRQHRFAVRPDRTGGAPGDAGGGGGGIRWSLGENETVWDCGGQPFFHHHLLLKMLLNAHSTVIMGRLGRYEGNVMTFVSPSNHKLVDRAVRYTRQILSREGLHPGYADVVRALFAAAAELGPNEAVVLKTVERIRRGARP